MKSFIILQPQKKEHLTVLCKEYMCICTARTQKRVSHQFNSCKSVGPFKEQLSALDLITQERRKMAIKNNSLFLSRQNVWSACAEGNVSK